VTLALFLAADPQQPTPSGWQRAATLGHLGGLPALQHLELEAMPAHELRGLPGIPSLRVLVLKVSGRTLKQIPALRQFGMREAAPSRSSHA